MNREQALNYLRSSGMSEEQIDAVVEALRPEKERYVTMEDAKARNMTNANLARYLRDYGKCRAGEIRELTLAAADRILELSERLRELEGKWSIESEGEK